MFNFLKKKTDLEKKEARAQELYKIGAKFQKKIYAAFAEKNRLLDELNPFAEEYEKLCTELEAAGGKTPDHWQTMKLVRAMIDGKPVANNNPEVLFERK